jgi:hypothetical protein
VRCLDVGRMRGVLRAGRNQLREVDHSRLITGR